MSNVDLNVLHKDTTTVALKRFELAKSRLRGEHHIYYNTGATHVYIYIYNYNT